MIGKRTEHWLENLKVVKLFFVSFQCETVLFTVSYNSFCFLLSKISFPLKIARFFLFFSCQKFASSWTTVCLMGDKLLKKVLQNVFAVLFCLKVLFFFLFSLLFFFYISVHTGCCILCKHCWNSFKKVGKEVPFFPLICQNLCGDDCDSENIYLPKFLYFCSLV